MAWGLAVRCEATNTRYDRALPHGPTDLVVLDTRLLDRRGLVFVREARDRHPNLPVLLTGAPGKKNEDKALRVGVRELVSRPFKRLGVKRTIFAALGREWAPAPIPGRARVV